MSRLHIFTRLGVSLKAMGRFFCFVAALGLVAVVGLMPLPAQAVAPGINAFETAWERVRLGQPDQPDPQALQDLAIYPYLVAARLARDLRSDDAAAVDGQVQAFLEAHAGEPVSWRLQRNWMRSLARREDWPALLAHYDAARDTSKLQCQRLHARIATGATDGLVPVITKAYLSGRTRRPAKPLLSGSRRSMRCRPKPSNAVPIWRSRPAMPASRVIWPSGCRPARPRRSSAGPHSSATRSRPCARPSPTPRARSRRKHSKPGFRI
ncbi:MAG: hypothetical protein L0H29_02160 [Sinobacteraceae bacterium]|nr:hypothetical protein [Nevskiaceae bacterium]